MYVFASGRRGWRGGEWMRGLGLGLGLGFTQSCGNRGSVGRVSVFWLRWCGWCMWRVGRGLGPGSGEWGGVMSVCVVSLDYLCRRQIQVSVCCAWRIPAHLRFTHALFHPVAHYGYLLPNMYLFIADITNPDSFV